MRLSTYEDDPGYKAWKALQPHLRCVAYLGGVRQKTVFMADTEEGTIVKAALEADGSIKVDRDKGEIVTETLMGTVTIEFEDPSKPEPV